MEFMAEYGMSGASRCHGSAVGRATVATDQKRDRLIDTGHSRRRAALARQRSDS
jgi:hypothetical protein